MYGSRRKYGNKVIETPEGKFDGKREWLRWKFLQSAEAEGRIKDLRRQVEFELIPKQEHTEVKHLKTKDKVEVVFDEHPVRYIADFVYEKVTGKTIEVEYFEGEGHRVEKREEPVNELVVEDFKGMRTPEYIIKRKLMLFLKGIKIREVKSPGEEI